MQYHTNHFSCFKSNWDNKKFEAEVLVTISNNVHLFSDIDINKDIENPDFKILLEEKHIEEIDETIDILKPNVLKWLEENIEDRKDIEENINGEEIIIDRSQPSLYKGWCINNNEDISNNFGEFHIYFTRQLDALKFINEFSVFKEPTTYFDYFNYDKREMDINKILEMSNKYNENELTLEELKFEIDDSFNSNKNYNNLDVRTFKLLDWESIDFEVSDDKKEEYYNILNNNKDIDLEF